MIEGLDFWDGLLERLRVTLHPGECGLELQSQSGPALGLIGLLDLDQVEHVEELIQLILDSPLDCPQLRLPGEI